MLPPDPKDRNPWRQVSVVLGMGFTFAAAVAIGVLLGVWLDGKAGTRPLFTLVLGALGFIAGLKELLRELKRLDRE